MKRFYFDQEHRSFSQKTSSEYNPDAIREMLAALAWQEKQDSTIQSIEHISEEELGLPKNLTTPDSLFYPEKHEPNYAYPVIVWLTEDQTSGAEFQKMMSSVSDRNYLGLEISLDQVPNRSCNEQLLSHIQAQLSDFGQQANIHPDRIYVAGTGACASLAINLILKHPLEFSGFLAINPVNRGLDNPLANFRFLKHLNGLLTTTDVTATNKSENKWVKPFSQLLHDAGIQMHLDTQSKSETKACHLINEVVMQSIWDSYSEK